MRVCLCGCSCPLELLSNGTSSEYTINLRWTDDDSSLQITQCAQSTKQYDCSLVFNQRTKQKTQNQKKKNEMIFLSFRVRRVVLMELLDQGCHYHTL